MDSVHDNNNNFLQTVNIHLSKEEYDGWTSDDTYILNLIASKLGFEIMNQSAVAITPTTAVTTDSNTLQATSSTTSQNTQHDHVDEGKYQPVMTHTKSRTNLPTRIGNPIKFCAVALKSSKVASVTFKFSIATS